MNYIPLLYLPIDVPSVKATLTDGATPSGTCKGPARRPTLGRHAGRRAKSATVERTALARAKRVTAGGGGHFKTLNCAPSDCGYLQDILEIAGIVGGASYATSSRPVYTSWAKVFPGNTTADVHNIPVSNLASLRTINYS